MRFSVYPHSLLLCQLTAMHRPNLGNPSSSTLLCALRVSAAVFSLWWYSVRPSLCLHHFFKSLCLLRRNFIPAWLFEPPVCSVSCASNAGAMSCARDFMSEYDWCPVFAASNHEYLCSRLVLAAVTASKRSGVLFQAVFRRPYFVHCAGI